jgi:hypothetical protein
MYFHHQKVHHFSKDFFSKKFKRKEQGIHKVYSSIVPTPHFEKSPHPWALPFARQTVSQI